MAEEAQIGWLIVELQVAAPADLYCEGNTDGLTVQ